jgi:DNA polymerase/3'-5' exonuclease PolX
MTASNNRLIAPVFKKVRLGEAENDAAYWRSRSYQERIEALEQIREEYEHWKGDAQPGFQRVYSILKR